MKEKMSDSEITIVKSPIVPLNIPDGSMIIYANQVTYSVRLSNGMVVTRPDEFPNEKNEKEIIEEP